MKSVYLLLSLLVTGCSTCNIPLGNYASFAGTEYEFSMELTSKGYSLTHQAWSPGNHENRSISVTKGTWSCSGNTVQFSSDSALDKATYQTIGANPLGLPANTKALVFEASEESVLSKEILYPSSVL